LDFGFHIEQRIRYFIILDDWIHLILLKSCSLERNNLAEIGSKC